MVLVVLTACGSNSSGTGGNDAGDKENKTTDSPPNPAPSQNPERIGSCSTASKTLLAYVADTKKFKHCDGTNWVAIEQSTGITVTSNKLIQPSSTNLCTEYSSIEGCAFNGGQVVKYSDGTVFLLGAYSYHLFFQDENQNSEYDRMSSAISLIIPPTTNAAFQRLDWDVTRPTSDESQKLFLVYQRSPEKVLVIFDKNGNGTPDTADETVLEPSLTDWN
jgi:hypothetical protein